MLPDEDAAYEARPVPDYAPDFVRDALSRLGRYFKGEPESFEGVPLDLSCVTESRRVLYQMLRTIGWGETVTYGMLADKLGVPGAARAIGRSIGANPIPIIVPCHRVLAAGGRLGGFTAPRGTTTKQELLDLEGAVVEWTRQMGFGF